MLSAAAALLCLQGAPDPGFLEARRTLDAAISAGTIPGAGPRSCTAPPTGSGSRAYP